MELQESHFLPAAAYRATRKLGGVAPVTYREGIALQNDDQMTAHILCADCEERFNRNGEDWVLRFCNRPGGFRLYDLVTALRPTIGGSDLQMYETQHVAKIDGDKLAYFCLSILWRGAAHRWKWGKNPVETYSLGPRYSEKIRKYLLGEIEFPEKIAVQISLLNDPNMCQGFSVPDRQRLKDGLWRYPFFFLGISFICFLGNVMDNDCYKWCIVRSPERYIFVGNLVNKVLAKQYAPTIEKARVAGRIRR